MVPLLILPVLLARFAVLNVCYVLAVRIIVLHAKMDTFIIKLTIHV